jgi:pimeloyl-ACP methyl ester carboxylesterase
VTTGVLEARNGDVRLACEARGDGPPLLLIMGLGYGRWGWEPVIEPLAQEFRVISFDNRGIGESDTPPGPYTVRQLAADAASVLDAVEFERAHVVGTSLGGMVAQELAITQPERVERLVLACTTPGGVTSYPMPQQTVDLILEAAQLDPVVALRRFVENALAPAAAFDRPELVERIMELRLSHRFDFGGWQSQAIAGTTFDAIERLGAIPTPTLVVTGTADAVVDWRNSELLAERIPDARLELFEGCGHLFFWEQPARFVTLVKEFLR